MSGIDTNPEMYESIASASNRACRRAIRAGSSATERGIADGGGTDSLTLVRIDRARLNLKRSEF
jgi:hypothetical protein